MGRRVLVILGALVAVGVLLLAALPFWLGLALRGAGPRFGVEFSRYERLGYSRFAFHDVEVNRGNVRVQVARIEADTPLRWSWRHVRGASTPILATTWSVEVRKRDASAAPPAKAGESGWMPLRATLRRIADQLARWLPDATTGPGAVRWPGGEISAQSARWRDRALTVGGLRYREFTADATLAMSAAGDLLQLDVRSAKAEIDAKLESRGSTLRGEIHDWQQTVKLAADFEPRGWMPVVATIEAPTLDVPGERLKLAAAYTAVRGRAKIDWSHGSFSTDVALKGEPVAGKAVPPLEVTLRGHGDPAAFTVETAQVVLPGITANLSAPVTVERGGNIRETAARFALAADLAKQPWFAARGALTGEARVVADRGTVPMIDFHIAAQDVVARDVAIARLSGDGRLAWPQLRVENVTIVGAAGDTLRGQGGWDFRAKEINDASVAGTLRRETVARWVPPQVRFEAITLDVAAAGPIAEITHHGRAEANAVKFGSVPASNVAVSWRGHAAQLETFSADAVCGSARISASGSASPTGLRLTEFAWRESEQLRLQLTKPAQVTWRPALQIENFHLSGPDAELNLDGTLAASGRLALVVHNVSSSWLEPFIARRGPAWTLSSVAVAGNWDRGPMVFSAAGTVNIAIGQGRQGTISLSARGDADGLTIEALHAIESGNAVVNATGRLPLTITPGTVPLAHIDPNGKLAFDAATVPNAAFWQQLATLTGVELKDPRLDAHLHGTWARPQGELDFRAARIGIDAKRFTHPLPSVDNLNAALTGEPEGLRLDRFSVAVQGQVVRASGRLPVAVSGWSELIHQPLQILRKGAQLRLEVPDAEVAMFARFLPAALAPAGRLEADISYDRGALGGYLRLHDAASRPLGPLGVLQQINADVAFSDHRITLRSVRATTGGQPVALAGTVELPPLSSIGAETATPRYDITLRGENLPFVRQTGMLVRGDLDLSLQSPPSGPPRIGGTVKLRDSLFLSDVRAFLPRGGASAARRPPYFSVDTPPLNTWTLAVEVTGNRFLRVRMPVFAGVASARFRLGGTLGEPRAIGEATIDEGRVMMPFTNFNVTQGAVRLTEENPFEPTIFLRGMGRHYGYDLTLEVSGRAAAPEIQFSSSPALDSEQVLLMVMTGAAPTTDVASNATNRALLIGKFFGQSLLNSLGGSAADEDRLTIQSGERISRQGKETYDLEYELNKRWSLTGEYDEFDDYNIGLKWRVAPRKTAREAARDETH